MFMQPRSSKLNPTLLVLLLVVLGHLFLSQFYVHGVMRPLTCPACGSFDLRTTHIFEHTETRCYGCLRRYEYTDDGNMIDVTNVKFSPRSTTPADHSLIPIDAPASPPALLLGSQAPGP